MAEYVNKSARLIHTASGAMLIPGVPVELPEKDLENRHVKALLEQKVIVAATEDDRKKAAEVEQERRAELAEQQAKQQKAHR